VMQESGCSVSVGVGGLRTESLPFLSVPGQSKLFIDYQTNPLLLAKYYPSIVSSHTEVTARIPEVLANYKTNRAQLCDALTRINSNFGAGAKTLENIDLLREHETVAVVTGQQTGLFTGPLYSIYKALSAIKMSECLRGRGINAVPVFWMATEDHDLEEISNAFVIDSGQDLAEFRVSADESGHGRSVGKIKLDGSVSVAVGELFASLPVTEFTDELRRQLELSWTIGMPFAEAFGTFLTSLLGKFGLIIVDPLNDRLKRLSASIYSQAVKCSGEIVSALTARSAELVSDGYHAQVLVEDDYFPLFWLTDDGRRVALRRNADGLLQVKGEKTAFTETELAGRASSEPERLSPGVMLRPVVQDYLFPTVCNFGGGAEIAYFAQNSEVYRILGRPVTPILHRQSFTIVEAKHARTLEKYELEFADLFEGETELLPKLVDKFIDPNTAKLFAEAEEKINTELSRLDQALSQMDVTLAKNLATRRRKIIYHIGALRKKYHFRRAEMDETIGRRIRSAFTALLPNGHLQERTLNVTSFLDRFGPNFIDMVYDSIDLDDKGHRIVYL
jgi:bacillithiol biosynthesis cysteine-adding enzyme BshC